MVASAPNPSTQWQKQANLWVQVQPSLHSEFQDSIQRQIPSQTSKQKSTEGKDKVNNQDFDIGDFFLDKIQKAQETNVK